MFAGRRRSDLLSSASPLGGLVVAEEQAARRRVIPCVPSPRRRHGSTDVCVTSGRRGQVVVAMASADARLAGIASSIRSTTSSASGLQHHLFSAAPTVLVQGYTPEVLAITGSSPSPGSLLSRSQHTSNTASGVHRDEQSTTFASASTSVSKHMSY